MAVLSVAEFTRVLEGSGWTQESLGHFGKGRWRIQFDTSSWMVLLNPRTMDVAVPDQYHVGWTVNLIEHLLRGEEEVQRLRAALAAIRDDPAAGGSAKSAASAALVEP